MPGIRDSRQVRYAEVTGRSHDVGDPNTPGGGLGTSILVVDDDPEIRDVMRWLLEDEGWTVETAADGRDALERATRTRPALIVLDMGLPILSGEQVAMRLHAVYADPPPIIVVSADGRAGEAAARIGATSYLHKPFDVDVLARLVRRTLAGR